VSPGLSSPDVQQVFAAPNPVIGSQLNLYYTLLGSTSRTEAKLYSQAQVLAADLVLGPRSLGQNHDLWVLPSNLARGLYFLRILSTTQDGKTLHSPIAKIYLMP
jgi:hypothetical protein